MTDETASGLAQIQATLPKDLKIAVVRDQSEFIETSLHAIEEHLILGGIFAAIVVFIFLWNFRSTLIAALAFIRYQINLAAGFAIIMKRKFLQKLKQPGA